MFDPTAFFTQEFIETIRNEAFIADKIKKLTEKQLGKIYEKNLFHLFVSGYGGSKEIDFIKVLEQLEACSWINGSFGWVVNLGAGAGLFSGFLNPDISKNLFLSPHTCLAGSGKISGTAEKVENGFIISGKWKYASGSAHATHFSANFVITKNGIPLEDENNNQSIISAIIKKEGVSVIESWNSTGLKASSSNDFEIKNEFVNEAYSFSAFNPSLFHNDPFYKFPFLQMAECNLAVGVCGMSLHFLITFKSLIEDKVSSTFEIVDFTNQLEFDHNEDRQKFYSLVKSSLNSFKMEGADSAYLSQLSLSAKKLVKTSLRLVDTLYPYSGMKGLMENNHLNMAWRDIHSASQHSLISPT